MLKDESLCFGAIELIPISLKLCSLHSPALSKFTPPVLLAPILTLCNSAESACLLNLSAERLSAIPNLLKHVIQQTFDNLEFQVLTKTFAYLDATLLSISHIAVSATLDDLSDKCNALVLPEYSRSSLGRIWRLVIQSGEKSEATWRLLGHIWMRMCVDAHELAANCFSQIFLSD